MPTIASDNVRPSSASANARASTFSHGDITEYCVSVANPGSPSCFLQSLRPSDSVANPVGRFVFGGRKFASHLPPSTPTTWAHGDGCSGEHLAGAQILGISGVEITPVQLSGQTIGYTWEDRDAQYCQLSGLLPADTHAPRTDQALACFERMEAALQTVGMQFTDVVRTWLYMDHLLDWYGQFNAVRTQFFHQHNVFAHMVPASTGIGASNPAGAAIVTSLLAIAPKHSGVQTLAIASPLQCPALDYQSSFSRAVEIQYPNARHLIISGTASIHPDGQSAHTGDIDKQIDLTMEVVYAILASRGMTWTNTTRAIAYFKNINDRPAFDAWCGKYGLTNLPFIPAHAAVCRDDLLFELELDAAIAV